MQRLPKLDPGTLAGRKREVYNTIAGGPRGGVRGPFVALLQCPDIADYVQGLGAHLRFEGALPGPLRELAILMTARFWTAAYEWCAHVTIAEMEGLAPEGITAIDDDPMGMVTQVPMKAGDVLFFLASAQTHGAFAWQGEMPRRGILMSYRSRNIFPD